MATPTEYTKQEWKIAVLEDDLAALQEENERLKARVERLQHAFFIACSVADFRGSRVNRFYPPMACEASLEEMGILPGDLEDPAPTLPVLGEECTERLDAPLEWEGE